MGNARRWAALSLAVALASCGGDDAGDTDAGTGGGSGSADNGQAGDGGASGQSAGASGSAGNGQAGDGGASGQSAGASGSAGNGQAGDGGASGQSAGASGDGGASGGNANAECALPVPIDEGVDWQRTLHVAMNGDDDAGDGSEGSPFASVDRALQEADPGTRVLVAAGTYGPVSAESLRGEATAPIGLYADGEVVLEGRGAGAVIAMSDPAYVVIDGFTLTDAAVHGMNIDDGSSYDTPAHHLVLRGLTIAAAGSGDNNDCIKLSGVDDFWVLGSDVAGCDMGEIIDMVGCHRGVISGNRFHDTVQNGVQAKGGSSDTLIHGNVFANIPGRAVNAGGSTGLEFFRPLDASYEAARISVIGNVFVGNGAMGGAAVAYVGCDGCIAAHNTIVDPQTWVARILQESTDARFVPSRDGLFVNNLIVLTPSELRGELVNVGGNTSPESFVFGNNLWFAEGADASWSPVLGGGVPDETNSIVQEDPLLEDRAGGDYRIAAGSPAAGGARELDITLPPDHAGNCFASPAAIGAFEAP